ncbi:hypothetical protein TWF696_003792 [Orbilia brochopaga]|uniref:F-box domain-containing protein n=1 Tax=Orbilia brochopaga TaxID=3140254 RepID=A0AAV9V471_9PEZI
MLLDVPAEILKLILEACESSSLKRLRLINSLINAAATPILFRELVLSFSIKACDIDGRYFDPFILSDAEWERRRKARIPSALQSRQDLPFLFNNVRKLTLNCLHSFNSSSRQFFDDDPDDWDGRLSSRISLVLVLAPSAFSDEEIDMLRDFVCSMKKLRTLRWNIPWPRNSNTDGNGMDLSPIVPTLQELDLAYYRQWQNSTVANVSDFCYHSFGILTNITTLAFNLYTKESLSALNNFPNLKSLTFRSLDKTLGIADFLAAQTVPLNLRRLSFTGPPAYCIVPDELFSSFSNLKTLHMDDIARRGQMPLSSFEPFFDSLAKHGVHPTSLRVCNPTMSTLAYLLHPDNAFENLSIKIMPHRHLEVVGESTYGLFVGLKAYCQDVHGLEREFMETFWNHVIPAQAATLRRLELEGPWDLVGAAPKIALQACKLLQEWTMFDGKGDILRDAISTAVNMPALRLLEFYLQPQDIHTLSQMQSYPRKSDPKDLVPRNYLKDLQAQKNRLVWEDEEIQGGNRKRLTVDIKDLGEHSLVRVAGKKAAHWRLALKPGRYSKWIYPRQSYRYQYIHRRVD